MKAIAVILLWSLFLSPNVTLMPGIPDVRLDDFLAMVILLRITVGGKIIISPKPAFRRYAGLLCLMCFWVMVTIIANNRMSNIGDYFEIYKLAKYFLVAYLFFSLKTSQKHTKIISLNIVFIFVMLFLFNLMNLFNIASFNTSVMHSYASELHLASGESLESHGRATRMLGTMGNPNNNAILWGFMAATLLALRSHYKKHQSTMLLGTLMACAMCLLAQSRTTLVALAAGLLVYVFVTMRLNNVVITVFAGMALGLGGYYAIILLNLDYLSSLWEMDIDENNSWQVRHEIWEFLYRMIKQSPWFGYGPNKDFFYQRELYAENEYILMAWRYGYVGVLFYLAWVGLPWIYAMKLARNADTIWAKAIVIILPLILVAAITNNPMSEPRLMLLYAAISGMMFAEVEVSRKNIQRLSYE